jgi:hypothetical protein
MDPKALREEALRETERSLAEKLGMAPDLESDEYEEEYRRQFELAKRRHAAGAAPESARVAEGPDVLPRLAGTPADERWAAAIRAERLRQVRDKAMRAWLAQSWVTAKAWIGSRELAEPQFLRRVSAHYAEHQRSAAGEADAAAAGAAKRQAAVDDAARKVARAGITPQELIALIDVSERLKPASVGAKLAEVSDGKRSLRVFLTDDRARLMVLEKDDKDRRQYAIPADEGLVGELKLYAELDALKRGKAP